MQNVQCSNDEDTPRCSTCGMLKPSIRCVFHVLCPAHTTQTLEALIFGVIHWAIRYIRCFGVCLRKCSHKRTQQTSTGDSTFDRAHGRKQSKSLAPLWGHQVPMAWKGLPRMRLPPSCQLSASLGLLSRKPSSHRLQQDLRSCRAQGIPRAPMETTARGETGRSCLFSLRGGVRFLSSGRVARKGIARVLIKESFLVR